MKRNHHSATLSSRQQCRPSPSHIWQAAVGHKSDDSARSCKQISDQRWSSRNRDMNLRHLFAYYLSQNVLNDYKSDTHFQLKWYASVIKRNFNKLTILLLYRYTVSWVQTYQWLLNYTTCYDMLRGAYGRIPHVTFLSRSWFTSARWHRRLLPETWHPKLQKKHLETKNDTLSSTLKLGDVSDACSISFCCFQRIMCACHRSAYQLWFFCIHIGTITMKSVDSSKRGNRRFAQ